MLQTSGKVKWLYGDAAVAAGAAEAAKRQDERASSVTKVDTSSSVAAPLAYAPLNGEVNDRLAELRAAYPKGTKRRWRTIARALGWSLTADDCLRRARFKAEHYNARSSVERAVVVWDKDADARLSELIDDTSRATPKRWRYIARTLGGNTPRSLLYFRRGARRRRAGSAFREAN
jgi:hypothetical protein